MAQPNFYLTNKYFALSPMVLHATMEAGTAVTLTVTVNRTKETVQIGLQADTQGKVVYDMAPLVRDLISRQFKRENLRGEGRTYGIILTTSLNNTYILYHCPLWAKASADLLKASEINEPDPAAWLLPSGKFTYNKKWPKEMISVFGGGDMDVSIYAKNLKTGQVIDLGDIVYTAAYNIKPSTYFGNLPAGEYQIYSLGPNRPPYFHLTVTDTDDCFPTEALKEGKMVYVRYCNQWGGLSYSLLQATERKKKNKNTYVSKEYALDGDPDTETIYTSYPDRVISWPVITRSG